MIRNAALGVGSARGARIVASEVEASLVGAALEVALAFVFASVDGVAEVAVAARAHGPAALHPAVGVGAAWSRRAEVVVAEVASAGEAAAAAVGSDAGSEGVAGESAGAGAHGDVVADRAVGVDTARRRARTDATVVLADLIRRAIDIFQAFGTFAAGVRIAFESGSARADGAATAD